MRSFGVKLLMVGMVAIIATSCAITEERSGPGADGDPVVSAVCAPDHPDCVDTIVVDEPETGGPTPTAPDEPVSSGFVVGSGLTIDEAIAFEGDSPVAVGGYVVTNADGTLLCESLAESFPPQCGGTRVTVLNPETLIDLVLLEEAGTQWSPELVVVFGHVSGTDLTVASNVNG